MVRVIDNFLEEKYFKEIQDFVFQESFPWYHKEYDVEDNNKNLNGFFYHSLYNNYKFDSQFPPCFNHLFAKLKILAPVRIQLNLVVRDIDCKESKWHVDARYNKKVTTAIFYLNDNNGKTALKLEDGIKTVDSKANRVLVFRSDIEHKAIYQTDVHKRYLLNMNYIEDGNN